MPTAEPDPARLAGELRTVAAATKANMENTCFICGLDRFTLDTKGGGFDEHIETEHNMWHYLYLAVHLKEKNPVDYNGWESYVARGLDLPSCREPDIKFMPRLTAITLKDHEEAEAAEAREMSEQQRKMADELSGLSKKVDSMVRAIGQLQLTAKQGT